MKRSKFSLSHHRIFSCDMGKLLPIGLTEVLPGDTIQQATTGLVRMSPLLSPVMARLDCRIHHFFVPMRLLWKNWEDFITGGPQGDSRPVFPTMALTPDESSLADYFGLPTGSPITVSALPFRAYALIYNEFFRDEDLMTELQVSDEDGPDTVTNRVLQNIAWEKDYFTSARPWSQKGPQVTIPVEGTVSLSGTGYLQQLGGAPNGMRYQTLGIKSGENETGGNLVYAGSLYTAPNGPGDFAQEPNLMTNRVNMSEVSSVFSGAGVGVNDLRLALSLQRMQEARARFGSRYVEYLRYLGVISSDARLQIPEYIAGGKTPIQFSEVLQTAEGTNPVGEMRGHGIGAVRSNRFRRYFEENGYLLTLFSIRPKTVYTQMLPKTWLRRTKEDFFQPELQLIGQQEVYNQELQANHSNPTGVFGYQDRYNEYRYHESSVSGEFRSILNYWHMARDFTGDVALNSQFVTCNPTKRIFASQINDTVYCFFNHSIQARRGLVPVANPMIK